MNQKRYFPSKDKENIAKQPGQIMDRLYHAIQEERDRGKAVPTDTIRHNASIWNNDLTDAL